MSSNNELTRRQYTALPRGLTVANAIYADRALGSEIWDVDGRRYVDFTSGISVLNVGHRHPAVVQAVERQANLFAHTAFQLVPYESYVALCERLNAVAPFSGPSRSILFTTGAEAVENAVKIARAHTGRSGVIAFSGGFHGRTTLTMALTGRVAPNRRMFGISPPGIFHVPFPSRSAGIGVDEALGALHRLFRTDMDPAHVAAIIIEPVQGEGGVHPAPPALLKALREIVDKHGIVLVSDEIQTGFGRTGKFFGIEHSNVEPDLVTVAKSLGSGFPIAGVIGRAHIMDAPEPGSLGGTFAGNPIGCAAALATLDVIESERLVERAGVVGRQIDAWFESFSASGKIPHIANFRGQGAMIGFDVVRPDRLDEPDEQMALALLNECLQAGLIMMRCGEFRNTIRLLMPLNIGQDILEEGLEILAASIRRISPQ